MSFGALPAFAVQATLASTANSAARKQRAAPYMIRRAGCNLRDLTRPKSNTQTGVVTSTLNQLPRECPFASGFCLLIWQPSIDLEFAGNRRTVVGAPSVVPARAKVHLAVCNRRNSELDCIADCMGLAPRRSPTTSTIPTNRIRTSSRKTTGPFTASWVYFGDF
jgi:hypothetical protein